MSVQNINQSTVRETGNTIHAYRTTGVDFGALVRQKSGELKFSAHAQARIKSRNIEMNREIMSKLDKAVSGAEMKGSKDTLVILSNLAFIVNVPNKTVVTAMEGNSMKDSIFTNIDSTVFAD